MRAFLALLPPPPLLPGLVAWQERFRECLPGFEARWIVPGQMHLTLRFFANLEEHELPALCTAVETAVQNFGPFPLRLGPAGCFTRAGRPRIFWVGLIDEAEALTRLFESVSRAVQGIGGTANQGDFHPHITVGRAGHRARRFRRSLEWGPDPKSQEARCQGSVEQLHLMRSTPCPGGVQYDSLASFPLRPALFET
ncbi:MAG TPA: RNA 2',3'-cyclic phosphodiesterase [Verrucomicrobiales bacterium]|nr:RNA 2',3'-cyclic phosphodiesterase [Verrucomicrobiales bacterium]